MLPSLTPKEKLILLFIKERLETLQSAPTFQEIKEHFGYASLNSVQKTIISLENKGHLVRGQGKKRGTTLSKPYSSTVSIPLIGAVACGAPILAIENIEAYIPTNRTLVKDSAERYFYLRAVGDSMNESGIHDNDLVLVHSQATANEGECVVALIDDSATIKHFSRKNGYIMLEPRSSNPTHKPIILTNDFSIQGVVVSVLQA